MDRNSSNSNKCSSSSNKSNSRSHHNIKVCNRSRYSLPNQDPSSPLKLCKVSQFHRSHSRFMVACNSSNSFRDRSNNSFRDSNNNSFLVYSRGRYKAYHQFKVKASQIYRDPCTINSSLLIKYQTKLQITATSTSQAFILRIK